MAIEHSRALQQQMQRLDKDHPKLEQKLSRMYQGHLEGGKTLFSRAEFDRMVQRTSMGTTNHYDHRAQFEFEVLRKLGDRLVPEPNHARYKELATHWVDGASISELFEDLHQHMQRIPEQAKVKRDELLGYMAQCIHPGGRGMRTLKRVSNACTHFKIPFEEQWIKRLGAFAREPTLARTRGLPLAEISKSGYDLQSTTRRAQHELVLPGAGLVHQMNLFVMQGLGVQKIREEWKSHGAD